MLREASFLFFKTPKLHIEFSKLHIVLKIKTHILNLLKDSKYGMVLNHWVCCGLVFRSLCDREVL